MQALQVLICVLAQLSHSMFCSHDLLDFFAREALCLGYLRRQNLLPHVDDEERKSDRELDQEDGGSQFEQVEIV